MNRKNFLRNSLLALAASLVPKILQPVNLEEEIFNWSNKDIGLIYFDELGKMDKGIINNLPFFTFVNGQLETVETFEEAMSNPVNIQLVGNFSYTIKPKQ